MQRHNFIMLAKVMTNLCNGVTFGAKEAHMTPLNNFLQDHSTTMLKFLQYISEVRQSNKQKNSALP